MVTLQANALAPIPSSGLIITANLPRAYRAGANRLNLWLDGREANQENILAFFIGLQDETILGNRGQPYSAATIAVYGVAVKRALMAGAITIENRAALDTFFSDIIPSVTPSRRALGRVLTPGEIKKLMASGMPEQPKALALFLYVSGVRIEEALAIRLSQYEDGILTVRMGKGHKERKLTVPRAAWKRALDAFGSSVWLFESRYGRRYASGDYWTRVFTKWGLEVLDRKVTCHWFRHSFATNLIKAGARIEDVSRMMGHSSIDMTANIYSKTELEQSAQANLMKKVLQ